jgi:hypothetical protein
MTAASCTPSRLGLFSAVAPEKRQQRGYALRQRAFFTPEIRPDSGCCSKPVSRNAGAGGMRYPQGRAPLVVAVSQTPSVPGTTPVRS